MGKTFICIKDFFIFKKGQRYYCFASDNNHLFFWIQEAYCGVNQINVKIDDAKNYFEEC